MKPPPRGAKTKSTKAKDFLHIVVITLIPTVNNAVVMYTHRHQNTQRIHTGPDTE
jgi:hypothetical protein